MRTLLFSVTLSFLLFFVTGCFFDSDSDSSPKIFEAPLIENLSEATKEESVTITLRTHPNSDIYLNKTKVATSDDTGVAHIKLIMQDDKEISEFELLVRDKKMHSETLFFSVRTKIQKKKSLSSSNSQITQIKLSQTSIELPETNTTVLHVNTYYDNNTTQTLTSNLQWIITNPEIVSIQNNTLKALKEGETTLKARYKNLTSQSLHVSVYKVINGHRLPPEPDEKINNSTLLGVDSNHNGARDDVERYLLQKYKDHHKIVSEIALQSARAFQIVLEHPENARETTKFMDAASSCNFYFKGSADSYGDPILINGYIMEYKYEELQLNTKDRIRAYLEYNHNLSGGVYRQIYGLEAKALCDFNTTELLKAH